MTEKKVPLPPKDTLVPHLRMAETLEECVPPQLQEHLQSPEDSNDGVKAHSKEDEAKHKDPLLLEGSVNASIEVPVMQRGFAQGYSSLADNSSGLPLKTGLDVSMRLDREGNADRSRLRRLIICLGDVAEGIPSQIKGLAAAIEEDLEENGTLVCDTILECCGSFSVKTGIFACLVGLSDKILPSFTEKLIDKLCFSLTVAIGEGDCMKCLLLIRFIVALVGAKVLDAASVFSFLRQLLDIAFSQNIADFPGTVADIPVYLVLASLPWFSKAIYAESKESYLYELLGRCGLYISKRRNQWQKSVKIFNFPEEDTQDHMMIEDDLERLFPAIINMFETQWQSQVSFRFYQSSELLGGLEKSNPHGSLHQLPKIELSVSDFAKHSQPLRISLRLPVVTELVASPLPIHDRWILENHFLSIMHNFNEDVALCAQHILGIPFVHDQYEYALVECVIGEMIRPPRFAPVIQSHEILEVRSNRPAFFYTRLLTKLKENSPTLPTVVEKIADSIVKKIVDLEHESYETFVEFLAYWWMVVDYKWGFSAWLVNHRPSETVATFVRRVMERLSRLTYYENMVKKLPEFVFRYIVKDEGPKLEDETEPRFNNNSEHFQNILNLMKSNVDDEDRIRIQKKIITYLVGLLGIPHSPPSHEKDKESSVAERATVDRENPLGEELNSSVAEGSFTAEDSTGKSSDKWNFADITKLCIKVILFQGCKTLAHMNRVVEIYGQILRLLRPSHLLSPSSDIEAPIEYVSSFSDEEYFSVIIQSIYDFWVTRPLRISYSLKSLVSLELLPFPAVLRYIFLELPIDKLDSLHNWEVPHQIIDHFLLLRESAKSQMITNKRQRIAESGGDFEESKKQFASLDAAVREMLDLLMGSLVVQYEAISIDSHPHLKKKVKGYLLSTGRRYCHFFELQEFYEKVETRMLSKELSEAFEEMNIFKKHFIVKMPTI